MKCNRYQSPAARSLITLICCHMNQMLCLCAPHLYSRTFPPMMNVVIELNLSSKEGTLCFYSVLNLVALLVNIPPAPPHAQVSLLLQRTVRKAQCYHINTKKWMWLPG